MRRPSVRSRHSGFTLVELFVVLGLIAILAVLGFPEILKLANRVRLEGIARQSTSFFHQARLEALKRNVPVVVRFDYANDEIFAYADVWHTANDAAGSDLIFNPKAGMAPRTTDYVVGRQALPGQVSFWGPADAAPEGADAVSGLTDDGNPPPNAIVFEANGSVRDIGGVRFADGRGNYLQVLIAPAATAKMVTQKWDTSVSPAAWKDPGGWKWSY